MVGGALTFEVAWRCAMQENQVRKWLFNNRPATAQELMRIRENSPFLIRCSMTGAFKMYGSCYKLSSGACLGLVLTWHARDGDLPLVAGMDESYSDNRYVVSRFVVLPVDKCVCSFECAWMVTGALSLRFHPYNAMSRVALLNYRVYAFASVDAVFLSTLACEETPNSDLVGGKFENLLLFKPWYSMLFVDVGFQAPCAFCTVNGELQCACPTPMKRRRIEPDPQSRDGVCATPARPDCNLYTECSAIMNDTVREGSILYNIVARTSGSTQVPFAGIVPFRFTISLIVPSHNVLQQFLTFVGTPAGNPLRLQITAVNSNESNNQSLDYSPNSSSRETQNPPPIRTADERFNTFTTSTVTFPSSSADTNRIGAAAAAASSLNAVVTRAIDRANTKLNRFSNGSTGGCTESPVDSAQFSSSNPPFVVPTAEQATNTNNGIAQVRRVAQHAVEEAVRTVENAAACVIAGQQIGTNESGVRIFTCHICGLQVKNKRSNLLRHIENKHTKNRKFECDVPGCERKFQSKHNLERHKRGVHSLGRPVSIA